MRLHLVSSLFLASALSVSAAAPLEVWIMPNGASPQSILDQRLEDFKKETGIEAKSVVLDWGEAWSRITQALESGKGPDVLQLGSTWVSHFSSQGLLATLDQYRAQIDPERFLPTAWSTTGFDGDSHFYAVPWFLDVRVPMGNAHRLNQAGIQAQDITTIEGFRKTLAKIRSKNLSKEDGTVIYPFAFPGKGDWNIPHNFAPWIWSMGGEFLRKNPEGKWHSALLEGETVRGIRTYIGFVLDSLINQQSLRENTAQVTGRFNSGEQVFAINTSEVIMQTRVPESEGGTQNSTIGKEGIRTFSIPAGPGGSIAFIGGSHLALPKKKEKDARALQLLMFLTRADNLDQYTRRIGFLPPDRSVLQIWAKDSLYKVVVQAAHHGRSYPNLPNWGMIEGMLVELFTEIWTLLDTPGMYTDEELYKILTTYHVKIEQALGHTNANATMSPEKFKAEMSLIRPLSELTTVKVEEPAEAPEKRGLGMAIAAGAIALIGLALFLRRKRNA